VRRARVEGTYTGCVGSAGSFQLDCIGDAAGKRASVQPGTVLHSFAERTERLSALDKLAEPLARKADQAARRAGLKNFLSGSWLGHPLHPLATDAVIGSWSLAAILDVRSGDDFDRAAASLVGFGVLAAIPTAASGVSDWADTPDPQVRRMGLVHAASNVGALALNAGSYLARRGGRRTVGAWLTAASALPLTVAGLSRRAHGLRARRRCQPDGVRREDRGVDGARGSGAYRRWLDRSEGRGAAGPGRT
jgi:hypothetical protein